MCLCVGGQRRKGREGKRQGKEGGEKEEHSCYVLVWFKILGICAIAVYCFYSETGFLTQTVARLATKNNQ